MPIATSALNPSSLHHPSDAELLLAAARQDQTAFSVLVQRYYPVVHRVVWRTMNGHADAEDIAQEAFLRLWKNPAQVREAGALKGWLMRVASNMAMDRFRAKATTDLDAAEHLSDGRPGAEQLMSQSWAAKRVDLAIATLPDRQRLALTMVHFEQFTNIEAAAAMDLSIDALESLLSRARQSLKKFLASEKHLLLATLQTEGA